ADWEKYLEIAQLLIAHNVIIPTGELSVLKLIDKEKKPELYDLILKTMIKQHPNIDPSFISIMHCSTTKKTHVIEKTPKVDTKTDNTFVENPSLVNKNSINLREKNQNIE